MARDQGDLKGASAVLDAVGCSLQTGRLSEGIWDERGNYYKLSRWVVADPVNVVEDDAADNTQALNDDGEDDVDDDDDAIGSEAKDGAVDEPRFPVRGAKGKARVPSGPNAVNLKVRLSDSATDVELMVDFDEPVRNILKGIRHVAEVCRVILLLLIRTLC